MYAGLPRGELFNRQRHHRHRFDARHTRRCALYRRTQNAVHQILSLYRAGYSVVEIAEDETCFQLSETQVRAALHYTADHGAAVERSSKPRDTPLRVDVSFDGKEGGRDLPCSILSATNPVPSKRSQSVSTTFLTSIPYGTFIERGVGCLRRATDSISPIAAQIATQNKREN